MPFLWFVSHVATTCLCYYLIPNRDRDVAGGRSSHLHHKGERQSSALHVLSTSTLNLPLSRIDSGVDCSFTPETEMADLNRPTQSPVLPRTTSPFAAPPSPSALSPASTSTLSLPQVDILNQEQSIAGSTNSATRTLPSLIRLDETRKCEYRMSDVELIATNNPYAFCSIQRDNTQYPPRRVIAQCSNSHFTQQWESRLSDLVIAVLKDLPWTWKLDVLRRGFTVDGQYNTSITPIVLYSHGTRFRGNGSRCG